jgi:hypothetical protein
VGSYFEREREISILGLQISIVQMLKQEPHSSGDRGWIVNIASMMGLIGGLENRMCRFIAFINFTS